MFLYSALVLNVIYLYVEFDVTSFYTLKLCPGQKSKFKFTKGNNSKNSWNRVMVLVHCTSPQYDLSVHEVLKLVSLVILKLYPGQDFVMHGRTDGQTDVRTDGGTDRVTPVYPPTSFAGY